MDPRKRQTATASPAEPGELPVLLADRFLLRVPAVQQAVPHRLGHAKPLPPLPAPEMAGLV
jgi:hypothetical protein